MTLFPQNLMNHKISNIINEHRDIEEGIHTGISVTVRGRLLNARSFGKLLFYDILDQSGKIQLLVNSGEIEDVYLRLLKILILAT